MQVSCQAPGLSVDAPAAISPHGQWLVTAGGADADQPAGSATVLVDLAAGFANTFEHNATARSTGW